MTNTVMWLMTLLLCSNTLLCVLLFAELGLLKKRVKKLEDLSLQDMEEGLEKMSNRAKKSK